MKINKITKRIHTWIITFLLMFCLLPSFMQGQIRIKFSTGINYLSLNEVNQTLVDWKKSLELTTATMHNWNFTGGKIKELHKAFEFEGELLAEVLPFLSVGLGSGYLHGESEEKDTWATLDRVRGDIVLGEYIYIRPTKASGIPVTLNLYAHLPLTSRLKLFLKGGGGYLWAKYIEQNGLKLVSDERFSYSESYNTSGSSPLVQAGLGMRLELKPNLSLVVEGQIRKARVKGFTGENKAGDEGTLYFIEELQEESGSWLVKHLLSSEFPEGENIRSVKDAVVDFSGFSLKLGFIINF